MISVWVWEIGLACITIALAMPMQEAADKIRLVVQ